MFNEGTPIKSDCKLEEEASERRIENNSALIYKLRQKHWSHLASHFSSAMKSAVPPSYIDEHVNQS